VIRQREPKQQRRPAVAQAHFAGAAQINLEPHRGTCVRDVYVYHPHRSWRYYAVPVRPPGTARQPFVLDLMLLQEPAADRCVAETVDIRLKGAAHTLERLRREHRRGITELTIPPRPPCQVIRRQLGATRQRLPVRVPIDSHTSGSGRGCRTHDRHVELCIPRRPAFHRSSPMIATAPCLFVHLPRCAVCHAWPFVSAVRVCTPGTLYRSAQPQGCNKPGGRTAESAAWPQGIGGSALAIPTDPRITKGAEYPT